MTKREAKRVVCAIAALALDEFDTGNLDAQDVERVECAAAELIRELWQRSGLDAIPATIDAIVEAVRG